MKSENNQLIVLRRMRKEGRLSRREYEELTGMPLPPATDAEPDGAQEGGGSDEPIARDSAETPRPSLTLALRPNPSANYLTSLLIVSISLIVVSALGLLTWWVSIPALLVLATTLFEGLGRVTMIGGGVVALLVVVSVVSSAGASPAINQAATPVPVQDPHPPVSGSLGLYLDQLTDSWNTVDGSPRIVRGLTRQNEVGEYDTFIYRFGQWGRVAGAFDPDDEAIYALLVTGGIYAEDTDQLYLHLCFVTAPYNPECIESYVEEGLSGGTLEDFIDVGHEAEWALDDHEWHLEISQNVMTIRVYGPDAA